VEPLWSGERLGNLKRRALLTIRKLLRRENGEVLRLNSVRRNQSVSGEEFRRSEEREKCLFRIFFQNTIGEERD